MSLTKKYSKKQIAIVIAGIVVSVVFLVYLGIALYFNSHFLFQTTINGVNASGKTTQKVEELIAEEITDYQLVLQEREDKEEIIQGDDIGLQPVFDGSLEIELKRQNSFAWPLALFQASNIEVETMVDYNKEKLEKLAEQLECMDEATMKAPVNAFISEYSKENGYEIVPEEEGTTIEKETFLAALGTAILNLQSNMSLEETECYVKPEITRESEELSALAEQLNKYTGAAITYEFGDSTEVLDGETISQWIQLDENQNVSILTDKISEYVASLAETYNTAGKSKSLATSYGTTITVSGGDYGWKIDKEAEAAALKEHIENGEVLSKEPAYSKTANSHNGNDYGSTYVEVNLTAQHMFFYKDGALILESDFVSGNEAKSWNTPTGAYGLYYKQKDKTLRGEGYATPVSFWMPFNGGVGFHDATWRNDFGGNYYKKNGSHGCVNLPYSAAKKLYENIEADCPVLVYKLPGTESTKSLAQDAAAAMVDTINNLGEITLASRDAVAAARAQYDGLNEMARGYVTNYDVLVAAEARIAELDAQAAAEAADQAAQTEAQPVIDAINTLANREITLDMKAEIERIRGMYNALSDAAKGKVWNYSILTQAEQILGQLMQENK